MAKDTRPVKTLEFKLYPNQSQANTLISWMDKGRKIWNAGLATLEELQQQKFRKKAGFDPLDGNELWEWRGNDVDGKKVFGLCSSIVSYDRKRGEYYPSCSIRYPKPLDGVDRSLVYQASESMGICSRFKNGIVADLMESWKAYQDPKRTNSKRPKYKGKKFPLTSLSNANASTTVKLKESNKIQFPLIGDIRTKGLSARIPGGSLVCEARICRKATGWYLQLAIRANWAVPTVKMPDVAVAVDPGVKFATSTDYGRQIESPNYLKKKTRRLRREQRKMSRRLQDGGSQGRNFQKQKVKVAKLHEMVSRQRSAFWHKESTYFVTNFGGIAIEDNSFNNMGRKAKAKPREDGKGYERNNQAQKRGLNRSLKDVACGKLKVMVEAKAKAIGNEIVMTKSHYNSQTCSECGSIHKDNRKSQSQFLCLNCGFSDNADVNAAINILNKSGLADSMNRHPKRTPVSFGGTSERKKPAPVLRPMDNVGSQQEEAQVSRSEITEQSAPQGEKIGIKIGKAKRGRKTPNLGQKPKTHIQLTLWD